MKGLLKPSDGEKENNPDQVEQEVAEEDLQRLLFLILVLDQSGEVGCHRGAWNSGKSNEIT